MIIGICGRKRHGKDSVGKILRREYGFTLTAFADPIKRVAMDVYGLTWEQCYGDGPEKEAVDPRWGLSPRSIMQLLGTEVGRSINPETWIWSTLNNIQSAKEGRGFKWRDDNIRKFVRQWTAPPPGWAITDVRWPNEAEAIRRVGGQVWKVVRPSLGTARNEHSSEASVDLVAVDLIITNDGSLEDLTLKVSEAYEAPLGRLS